MVLRKYSAPLAAMAGYEGKAVLFKKRFAGVDGGFP